VVHVDGEARGELALGLLEDDPAVGEGFGGPYMSGSTDVGTGIVYALLFITLLTFARPPAGSASAWTGYWSRGVSWWQFAAEPHVDRARGAPLVEPVIVGERQPGTPAPAPSNPAAQVPASRPGRQR
jgi:hypothetical protein